MVPPGTESATDEKEDAFGGLEDIFAEDDGEDAERLAAFADLEQLTMIEVAAETEAVLEELKIRQEG